MVFLFVCGVLAFFFSEDTFRTAECREGKEGEKWWEEEIILKCSLPTGQNTYD